MAAESPIKIQKGCGNGGQIVLPQPVTDPSILDSVAGFINDVVPVTYNPPSETKDQIQWAKFEYPNSEESTISGGQDCDKILPPPIFLVLGYSNGIQVWSVAANGEAKEILSWRHGVVRALKILPTPHRAANFTDAYATKRPIMALCDNVTPGSDFCYLNFLSLKTGEQVRLIKFKNQIVDVTANSRSIVVTLAEKIAVFDAFTLEDRLSVTTCYLSPGINANPVALGTKWLAYAENKLIMARRSSGGNDGEGVQSYTASVLHAAKSLGRGLRELGETVANSLTGSAPHRGSGTGTAHLSGQHDVQQKGVVTILDIENKFIDNSEKAQADATIAHFTAHSDALVHLCFDPSGILLATADKRGYDFHVFRIYSHPLGPASAAVHHLYVLHRGDTTAKVQDMSFSPDSRWVTVSTLRGTTHVFPITPYGGNVGVRTHASPHVVNKMSRFHRSAGLTAEGRSNSPVTPCELPVNSNLPYPNPRLPPFPHPIVIQPLAQIRQPMLLQNYGTQQRHGTGKVPATYWQVSYLWPLIGRQRLGSSSSEESQMQLRVCVSFAPARAWLENLPQLRESTAKPQAKPVESLFIMSCQGNLIQYDLEPHASASIPKEKICDDSVIELTVQAKAQWFLQRPPGCKDLPLAIGQENLNMLHKENVCYKPSGAVQTDDRWLSQVEILTHAGPHRRLWMGPQFTFKTYNNSGSPLNIAESQPIDVLRSKPVNMPLNTNYHVLIEAGSVSSCEPSPKLFDNLQRHLEESGGAGELQLREDLADAMLESPGIREAGGRCVIVSMKPHTNPVAKVVNPLGMVVTVQSDDEVDVRPPPHEEVMHENCDEALFRPVVASKAVLFAEPRNIRSKIAANVLHVNKFFEEKKIEKDVINVEVKNVMKPTKIDSKKSDVKKVKKTKINIMDAENEILPETLPDLDELDFPVFTDKKENESKEANVEVFHDSFFDANEACEDLNLIQVYCAREKFEINNELDVVEIGEKIDSFENLKSGKESSSEENVDEKQAPKKPRKPKTKLGVRITNIKPETETPIKSWSSIVSHKNDDTTTLTYEENDDESPADSGWENSEITDDLLKIEKSSDDEKQEVNSSQTETTESDDSGRIPAVTIMDTEEDPQLDVIKPKQTVNKSKRSKKKRR